MPNAGLARAGPLLLGRAGNHRPGGGPDVLPVALRLGGGRAAHGSGRTYTLFRKRGRDVAAGYRLKPDQKGVPPHWQVYVRAASADEAAARAKELGATVLAPPFDVFDAGRMAVLQDPTGAVFSVWEARRNKGLGVVDEPGAFCWAELIAKDLPRAETFYKSLFGWRTRGDPRYTEWTLGDRSIGGMIEMQKDWGEMPPHWLVYFQVEGCDRSVEKAKGLGAKVTMGPRTFRGGPHRSPERPAGRGLLRDPVDRRRTLSFADSSGILDALRHPA